MLTVCWAAKGGSGTTVVAASLGVMATEPCLLVDLAGDLPLALGHPAPPGPGVGEWSRSTAPPARLDALRIPVTDRLDLIARGDQPPTGRWEELARYLATAESQVIVDAGTGAPPAELRQVAQRTWLITRSCYLALCRALSDRSPIDGIVMIDEPGHAFGASEFEAALGAPVVARLLLDPAIARATDSGLLLNRLPRGFRRQLSAA